MQLITRQGPAIAGLCAAALAYSVTPSAQAASLQPVSNWGSGGLPSDVSMYVYVPDQVVANPPVLTLIHYCGGTASAVFGQAQGGGIVSAADQYGFIMVVPSSGRCWDVVSDKTRKRDGDGDSHAIRQMVKYAVDKYKGNPERVYSTGDSSGGMMTELLLAIYPDVFKAGSAFAGMPAGCRGANETGSNGGYSNACAGGSVSHTAQEWGDIARSLYPGYTGRRPRVQLFHGDADTTIKYPNFTEAIKEWGNVLSLGSEPTSTDTALTLGTHRAKRQTWKNACGYVDLDAFTSVGGDHGPSDALFVAKYVIPFLALDKTGAVDPEVEQCNSGGASGSAGASAGGSGGALTGSAGTMSVGGSGGVGTASGAGGASGASSETGGGAGSAGYLASGGKPATAGSPGNGSSGASMSAGAAGVGSPGNSLIEDGCSYSLTKPRHPTTTALATLAAVLALVSRRRPRLRSFIQK